MYGPPGLKQQLEELHGEQEARTTLVKYLGHRAVGAVWGDMYRTAARRYLSDTEDVSLFGVLIRDVPPHHNDLRARSQALCTACPPAMRIGLLAIYLPEESIVDIGKRVELAGGPSL